jgi:hypothetical protein
MKSKLIAVVWLAGLVIAAASCGSQDRAGAAAPGLAVEEKAAVTSSADFGDMEGGAPEEPRADDASPAAMVETAKIIRTASLALEVSDIPEAEKRVRELVEEQGGYISDSEIAYTEGYGAGGTLTARIPAENYAHTYRALRDGEYGYLITASEQTQDVTEEWVDTESRIQVLEEEREKLRELLERRGELGEILEVEREILDVQMRIEQAQGRLNVLKNRVSLSTITIELRLRADESELARQEREADKWRPRYVFDRAKAGLVRTLQGLANFLIVVLTYIPCWGPIALILWLLYRRLRKASQEQRQQRSADEERRIRAWEEYRRAREETDDAAAEPENGATEE